MAPEKRSTNIIFRVEPSLKEAADKLAVDRGRPLSDILRTALIRATGWEQTEE